MNRTGKYENADAKDLLPTLVFPNALIKGGVCRHSASIHLNGTPTFRTHTMNRRNEERHDDVKSPVDRCPSDLFRIPHWEVQTQGFAEEFPICIMGLSFLFKGTLRYGGEPSNEIIKSLNRKLSHETINVCRSILPSEWRGKPERDRPPPTLQNSPPRPLSPGKLPTNGTE